MPPLSEAERTVILAYAAEDAERYDDMSQFMKERVQKGGLPMTPEERDLLSAAFKGALASRRHGIRVADAAEESELAAGRGMRADLAAGYRSKLEAELLEICEDVIELLNDKLILTARDGEPKTFYLKMLGDYHRYIAEVVDGKARAKAAEGAKKAYTAGLAAAEHSLLTTHPVRLGLALNFSVFQHEVLHDAAAALSTAKGTLQAACANVHKMPEEAQRDAAPPMQLLQDNVAEWEMAAARAREGEPEVADKD